MHLFELRPPYFGTHPSSWVVQYLYLLGQRLDKAVRSRHKQYAPFPTVCVGNFQAGGTGKTPMTLWVAKALADKGYAPIILLRGYKGRADKSTVVDRPDASYFGDEALLHARHFTTIVGKKRLESAQLAQEIATTSRTVLVLDDGLQHYELIKDFSMVCEKNTAFEHDTLLPYGRLREVPHNQIDAIISTVEKRPETMDVNWRGVPKYFFTREMRLISGAKVPGIMVCGLARPNDFFFHVQREVGKFMPVELAFGDHHRYSETDIRNIARKAAAYNDVVHCTAKDAVKLAPLVAQYGSPIKLSVWDVVPKPLSPAEPLVEAMIRKIEEVYRERAQKGG